MADRAVLDARPRTLLGKRVKRLRREGRIPATVYGHDVEPQSIDVDARSFRRVHSQAGDNQLVDLVLDGQRPRPVLIHTTQVDPRRHTAMHVEFYQANLREKLTARIPIHFVGESPAVRHGLMVLHILDGVDVECLPTDLPPHIEVDVSGLEEVGSAIHVRDLQLDRELCSVKIDPDETVVLIAAPQVVREEEEAAEEAPAAAAEAPQGEEASSEETSGES